MGSPAGCSSQPATVTHMNMLQPAGSTCWTARSLPRSSLAPPPSPLYLVVCSDIISGRCGLQQLLHLSHIASLGSGVQGGQRCPRRQHRPRWRPGT